MYRLTIISLRRQEGIPKRIRREELPHEFRRIGIHSCRNCNDFREVRWHFGSIKASPSFRKILKTLNWTKTIMEQTAVFYVFLGFIADSSFLNYFLVTKTLRVERKSKRFIKGDKNNVYSK